MPGTPTPARIPGRPPSIVFFIAGLAVFLNVLDLLSGIRMMLVYGVDLEQNPIARTIFQVSGPVGLSIMKLTVVLSGVFVLVLLARAGRTRLARTALATVALVGLLGFASNLV